MLTITYLPYQILIALIERLCVCEVNRKSCNNKNGIVLERCFSGEEHRLYAGELIRGTTEGNWASGVQSNMK